MAMFERLAERVGEQAERMAGVVRDRIDVAVREFPDVEIAHEGNHLVIRARGLMRRVMTDIRLRFALRGLK